MLLSTAPVGFYWKLQQVIVDPGHATGNSSSSNPYYSNVVTKDHARHVIKATGELSGKPWTDAVDLSFDYSGAPTIIRPGQVFQIHEVTQYKGTWGLIELQNGFTPEDYPDYSVGPVEFYAGYRAGHMGMTYTNWEEQQVPVPDGASSFPHATMTKPTVAVNYTFTAPTKSASMLRLVEDDDPVLGKGSVTEYRYVLVKGTPPVTPGPKPLPAPHLVIQTVDGAGAIYAAAARHAADSPIQTQNSQWVMLHWNPDTNAQGYRVEIKRADGTIRDTYNVGPEVTSKLLRDIPGALYCVRVKSSSGISDGDWTSPDVFAAFSHGVLRIDGTNLGDSIFVSQDDGRLTVFSGPAQRKSIPIYVDGNYAKGVDFLDLGKVFTIDVHGHDGDDRILLNQGSQSIVRHAVIDGGNGNDFVAGIRDGKQPGDNQYSNCEWIAQNWAPHSGHTATGSATATPMEDISQGDIGNCSFLASLGEVALRGTIELKGGIDYLGDDGNPAHAFTFVVHLHPGPGKPATPQKVNFNGYVGNNDPKPYQDFDTPNDKHPKGPYQFWTILYRRAYLGMTKQIDDGISEGDALTSLTGRASKPISPDDAAFKLMEDRIAANGNVVAGTYDRPSLSPWLIKNHDYTVVAVSRDPRSNAPASVTMYNPWGSDVNNETGKKPSGPGSNPDDGIVTVPWNVFKADVQEIWLDN
jgi:hypothetical protein